MRLLDRLVRALVSLLLLAVSAALALVMFTGWNLPERITAFRGDPGHMGWFILAGIGAVISGALAILCLLMPHIRKKHDKGYVLQKMGDDRVSVSRDVVENLATACIREHRELERCKVYVHSHREGVNITVVCRLRAGTDLTRSVDYIQRQIRRHVTDTTGLKVHQVLLKVESLTGEPLPVPDVPTHEEPGTEILPAGHSRTKGAKNARRRREKEKNEPVLTDGGTEDEGEPETDGGAPTAIVPLTKASEEGKDD